MTILQNRRTTFSLTDTDVISSSTPSSEAGIEKSAGQEGFFIYTSKAFDLWFKDANGAWSLYDSYGLADIADGVAFSWNTNTAAFVRTQEASHQVSVFVIQTKTVGSFGNQEQTTLSSVGYDRLDEHSNYKRVRMQNSGHTGEAYAIAVFDASGEASYISAPVSGQREGKTLGWDENGALGWITLTSAAVAVTSPSQYWDGSSTSTQLGSNTLSLGGATLSTTDGKYGSDSFSFGASGNKQPMLIGTDVDLSTGIYTFSLWFKNKRAGSDWGSVFRQTKGPNGITTANYPILTRNTDNILGMFKRESSVNTFHSTGYSMLSFEGDSSWNHLAVVADGTNSTFYINGSQVGNTIAKVITTSVGEIGAHNNSQVFAEALDEIAYWDSALEPCQINTIYSSSEKLGTLVPFGFHGDVTESGGVYSFDGNGDYLTYNSDFRYTDQFSITIWFKVNGNPSDMMVICSNHDAGAGGTGPNGNVFFLQTNGKLRIKTQDSGNGTTGDALNVGSNLADNSWHQLVVTWQASTANGRKIYIDGSLISQNNSGASNTWRTTTQSLTYLAGMWNQNTNSFSASNWLNGQLANFSLVNSILSSTEIQDDYDNNSPA